MIATQNSLKINLTAIPTETGHHETVFKKVLINKPHGLGEIQTMNHVYLKSGMVVEPHVHETDKEFYLFLDGSGVMVLGEERFEVGMGDFVEIPVGKTHSIDNTGIKDLVLISLRVRLAD